MGPERARAARELLAFYREAGVDAVVSEEPVNRLADQNPASAPAAVRSGGEPAGRQPRREGGASGGRAGRTRSAAILPHGAAATTAEQGRGGRRQARRRPRPKPP